MYMKKLWAYVKNKVRKIICDTYRRRRILRHELELLSPSWNKPYIINSYISTALNALSKTLLL